MVIASYYGLEAKNRFQNSTLEGISRAANRTAEVGVKIRLGFVLAKELKVEGNTDKNAPGPGGRVECRDLLISNAVKNIAHRWYVFLRWRV